tara:strand:- start:22580 stop:22975 length:396 start_codon:yes stop_codon:yes gene_type:complete
MARRTTASLVRLISDVSSSTDIEAFIDTASMMTDLLEEKDTKGILGDQQLELIERWLSAHMITLTVNRKAIASERQIDVAKVKWDIETVGSGLTSTAYGQQAMALDTTGNLEGLYGDKVYTLWIGDNNPDG